ncbi:nucleolar MIF4G domain-containing protein 1-like [Momordica charantia]|uniref:Nucleolar MIF4G domain-containing protein 1-like n=1 Tax=Momordica charantia TaxID=3673 RepID=A0A6J1D6L2_MOMCH|nr:nucleolar MIF4G domain-containing protein 1-like [Momordica charantia]XP_022149368.1 nucleolar MIF4G domain-containing protein 1-like [Momordica charantia]XP_022149374.1 nucleolar MIF4G domain-containing protein 1-like [Momordica charantia]
MGKEDAKLRSRTKHKGKTKFEEYLGMETSMRNPGLSAEEDLELERKLAKKLKVKAGKLRGEDDGINVLFEGMSSMIDSPEEDLRFSEEFAVEPSKKQTLGKVGKKRKSSDQGPDGDFASVEASEADIEVEKSSKASKSKKRKKKKMLEQHPDDIVTGGIAGDDSIEVAVDKVPVKALEGNQKYVAPYLRLQKGNESEDQTQLRRRVRGLLNRLSESNVESIIAEMSTIFRSISRSIASQVISEEVLASCSRGPRGNEQYAAVFASFVAGMGCLVGTDFSARLMASLAKTFEDEHLKEDNLSLRNLTLLLSYLCIFGVCASDLIYDFLNILSKRLTEIDVSTILTVLQCCGMKIRGDDPTGMKNFIVSVQSKVNELKAAPGDGPQNINGKRMEFMLETICDIKNNKKRHKDDPAHHTRIKKWLQKLRVEDILIRGIKWNKLIDPDKKGQWWLSGDMSYMTTTSKNVTEFASTIDKEVVEAQKMLQLAAAQRMNTDARKAIFCIIMSGEDYVDAFEKLLRLDLPGMQDREIMRVVVECCLQEKVFNKYYTILASKLCAHDKNHKFTLQYCLWDHFKELETMQLIRSMNLAKFVVEMITSFTLSLAVLKSVDLSDVRLLTPKRIMHFRMLFDEIFKRPDKLIWNVFTRVAVNPELEPLRSGMLFFIREYMIRTNKVDAKKFKLVKKALNNVEGVLM